MQNINILTLGNPQGKGVFFPEGLLGNITTPYGFNMSDPGNETFPTSSDNSGKLDTQVARCLASPHASCPVLHCGRQLGWSSVCKCTCKCCGCLGPHSCANARPLQSHMSCECLIQMAELDAHFEDCVDAAGVL